MHGISAVLGEIYRVLLYQDIRRSGSLILGRTYDVGIYYNVTCTCSIVVWSICTRNMVYSLACWDSNVLTLLVVDKNHRSSAFAPRLTKYHTRYWSYSNSSAERTATAQDKRTAAAAAVVAETSSHTCNAWHGMADETIKTAERETAREKLIPYHSNLSYYVIRVLK